MLALPPSARGTSPTSIMRRVMKRCAAIPMCCFVGLGILADAQYSASQKKSQVWALQNWLHDADQRTREFYEGRARAPVTWILVDGRNIPTNVAIVGGEEGGSPHYICRGYHEVGRG